MAVRPSAGRVLQFIAVTHAGVGVILHRRALGSILRARVIDTVGDRGDRATAFWFMLAAPLLWSTGRLLRSVERSGELDAQRDTGVMIAAAGVAGVAVMPRSPFWFVTATGVWILRGARQRRSHHGHRST